MRFYRGIAVSRDAAPSIIAKIRSHGLQPGYGRWTMIAADLKPRLNEIWQKTTVTFADTHSECPSPSWVCACAEEAGALYYACIHNKSAANDTPILIAFDADPSEVIVDGRDFLYTLFQTVVPQRARPIVERVFGSGVLRYIDRAWSTTGQERTALCDLAVQDDSVVVAHATNQAVIEGRSRTRFRSAFLVRSPVLAERIKDVRIVDADFEPPHAEISLTDVL
jgi:hypothetical protein